MEYNVPFIENSDDDLRCVPASFLMIAKYFQPDLEVDWDEWSELMGYADGLSVWPAAGMIWFSQNGYEIRDIEQFDYRSFINEGANYLLRTFGTETGQWQVDHSDIELEQSRAVELLKLGIIEHREPLIADIHLLLDQGFLIRALVNSKKLNDRLGYSGHSVVIIGYEDGGLIIHDPGLPAVASRSVSNEVFESAWAYPDKLAKELNAFRMT